MTLRAPDSEFADRLAAARRGDRAAWTELYHEVAPLVIGYLRAQRLPDADDVAGEVFLAVVRDLHQFSGGEQQFRSWVLAIAHHRLLDARRHDRRRPSTPTPMDELDVTAAPDDPEMETLATIGLDELEPALASLTEDQRTVLLLRVIGDLPVAEVARITGRRTGAVKQLQRRAVDSLRRHLVGADSTEDDPGHARAGRTVRDAGIVPGASPPEWAT